MSICAICIDEIEQESSCCILPGCGHHFHTTCILNAVRFDTRCPVCRNDIPDVGSKNTETIIDPTVSFESMVEEFRRNRIRYMQKKRRIINKNIDIKNMNENLKKEKKSLRILEDEMQKVWDSKVKEIWKTDSEVFNKKSKIDFQRRRCSRIEKKIKTFLSDKMDPPPDFMEDFLNILN